MAVVESGTPSPTDNPMSPKMWLSRISQSDKKVTDKVPEMVTNIDYRRGKPFASESDVDRIAVNLDWSLTKTKVSSLFSAVPNVRVTSDFEQLKPVAYLFGRAVNKRLNKANLDSCMNEVLADTVNAAGYGAVIVGYQARKGPDKLVPQGDVSQIPPEQVQAGMENGQIPSQAMPTIAAKRFYADRISPSDLLVPADYTRSNFDQAPWVGRKGRMSWSEGVNEFGLQEEQRAKVTSGDGLSEMQRQTSNTESSIEVGTISYSEVFYRRYMFDPAEMSFDSIWRIVFVDGLDEPVIDAQWDGQKLIADGYLGACDFPIRVLTLAYLTDEPLPPSDSSMGRPQVDELIKSRSQMVLQRDRSMPVRFFDVNRIDPMIHDTLLRGTWQGWIPVNGRGADAIGEVSRAVTPREDFEFDRVAKSDLQDIWRLGPNQLGQFATGERSAKEAENVQQGFQTGNSYERSLVGKFFVGIAKVMAGLMALYDDFKGILDPKEAQLLNQTWGEGDQRAALGNDFSFNIRQDSTVLLDSEQRLQQLVRVLNLLGKHPNVNAKPIVAEILDLSDVDLITTLVDPQPSNPEPAAISIGMKGAIDLHDQLLLAFLLKSGQAPGPDQVKAAAELLKSLAPPPEGPQLPPIGGQPPELPPGPPGPPGPPNSPQGMLPEQREGWTAGIDRVTKRTEEAGG